MNGEYSYFLRNHANLNIPARQVSLELNELKSLLQTRILIFHGHTHSFNSQYERFLCNTNTTSDLLSQEGGCKVKRLFIL
jgi:hypothetical protein